MGEPRSETTESCKAGGSVGDKIEMLRQAAVSLSVGSDPPGADTVGAKQGSRLHDVCTLTVPHCSSNMDSVCSGACTMNHHLVFSPLVLNLRLTRRPDGRLGQSREMAFLIAVTVQLFIVPQILPAPVTLLRLLWLLNREECGAELVVLQRNAGFGGHLLSVCSNPLHSHTLVYHFFMFFVCCFLMCRSLYLGESKLISVHCDSSCRILVYNYTPSALRHSFFIYSKFINKTNAKNKQIRTNT